MQKGTSADTPKELDTPAKRALYSNLPKTEETAVLRNVDVDPRLEMALKIDFTVLTSRPDNWRGNVAKENLIKQALLPPPEIRPQCPATPTSFGLPILVAGP